MPALALGLVAFAARLGVYRIFTVPSGYAAANIAAQALRGFAAYGLVMAAVGYARRYLNRESAALVKARDLATYLLLGTGLGAWARWAIAVAASWLTVALFTYVARFVPLVREFFGIRARRKISWIHRGKLLS